MSATIGIAAARTLRPTSLDEAHRILADAAATAQSVAFVGGATELGFGYAPRGVDVLLETTALDRVVEYHPADMVVEVECGITLAALQEALRPHGQRLALDPPHGDRATLGGLVATNAFGPRRTRYGSLRDLIVGVSLIRADGTRARGGGKVVKNVAGFDLPKLAVGSLGSLGMIATATFRLHPLPETTSARRVAGRPVEEIALVVREMLARQLEPVAVIATREADAYDLDVVFDGFSSGVAEQCLRFDALASALGVESQPLDDVASAFARDVAARSFGDVRMRFALPPDAFARFEREALVALRRTVPELRAVAYPTLGVVFAGAATRDVDGASDALAAARRVAEAAGGNAVVLEATDPIVAERLDAYGTLPPSFGLMRGLKDRFDPSHRLNPGRFLGRL
ncbi:MAG: FAD-binding oxidoreductase [Vulcanimicrobiaceae bacterium]